MSAHNRFKIQAACVRYNDSCMSASERATSTFVSLCDSDRSPIGFILGSDFLLFEKKIEWLLCSTLSNWYCSTIYSNNSSMYKPAVNLKSLTVNKVSKKLTD